MAIDYKRTYWEDEVTPLDADNMNNIEEAIESLSSKAVSNISDGGGKGSVAQIGNVASGEGSAAFGVGNTATGLGAHAEGSNTLAEGDYSHTEGLQSVASGPYSHAEGQSKATAWQSHAENVSTASGEQSHSEGAATASGKRSHAEGSEDALAKGDYSHAEGGGKAYGERSHAEGSGRTGQATEDAGAWEAHAEGAGVALGVQSHAEGNGTVASGEQSHVEGINNTASGKASHAQGIGNTATDKAEGQFVAGRYSKAGKNGLSSDQPDEQLIVRIGAGTSAASRWTVFSIDNNGTTCMSSAGVNTDGIVTSWNVINREYADAHYVQISSYTKTFSNGHTLIIPKGSEIYKMDGSIGGITFNSKTGVYLTSLFDTKNIPATDLVTKSYSFFFTPLYVYDRGGGRSPQYAVPIYWYNTTLSKYCDADGTENANGQFIKVTCRLYYAERKS